MPKQILLADDSITIQKVIALTFAGEDYKITAVNNGADAVTKARELKPDIVLADVMMPQKNGYEVCEALKSDPELKDTPVLLLAGTFEPFDEEVAKKAGSDGFIIKPFESQALIQKVRELIGAKPAKPAAAAPVPGPAVPKPHAAAPAPTPVSPVAPAAPVPSKAPVVPAVAPVPPQPRPQPAPVVTPPAVPAPPIARPPQPSEEDFWGTMMDEVEEKKPPKIEQPVKPQKEEILEEEVWDAGEFEEETPVAAKEEEVWETFAFEEAEAEGAEEALEAPEVPEDEFSFVEEIASEAAEEVEEIPDIGFEEAPAEETFGVLGEEAVHEEEEFTFGEELPEVPGPPVQIVPQPEILQGYEQTFEPEAMTQELPVAPPPETVPMAPPSAAPISEEQIRAALGQVSREVIEKIVWEIVPDLAEMLIKAEIKRLQKKQ